jgi:osmoprotectant transport system ATP-binding protein
MRLGVERRTQLILRRFYDGKNTSHRIIRVFAANALRRRPRPPAHPLGSRQIVSFERGQAFPQANRVKLRDGERADAAFETPRTARKPRAAPPRGLGHGRIHDLYQLRIRTPRFCHNIHMPPGSDQSASVLEIRDLSCRLGERWILRGISLEAREGETVVLLGRSGCGKTTLLKCVNGLVAPAGGEIRFQGRPAPEWDLIRLRRRIGYVIQDAGLFPHWTVAANVGLVPTLENWDSAAIEARVELLLEAVGLPPAQFAGRYPRELSGGQKQRVGIARALAADPPLLLLDEPFAALDPITRYELQRQFATLQKGTASAPGKAAVFVTHDVREALMLATRIVLFKDGIIDVMASPAEFLDARTDEARAFLAGLEQDWHSTEAVK